MKFNDCLNSYIKKIRCSAKELSEFSGISPSAISRYRSGDRTPDKDSEITDRITMAIIRAAEEHGVDIGSESEVRKQFEKSLFSSKSNSISEKLNRIMEVLSIPAVELAAYLKYDTSYISRIRNNKRRPSDKESFVRSVALFITERYHTEEYFYSLSYLLGVTMGEIEDTTRLFNLLCEWFTDEISPCDNTQGPVGFIKKIDEFNLENYIESIKFNDIKIPTVPFQFNIRKIYSGIEELRKGEIDFFKSVVLSKSKEPVTLCVDMPMEDMAEDIDFSKKWMMGLALILKKGLDIQIIHNLNRPFEELMLGLESWIPLYMTGQVKPFYHKEITNTIYGHLHYSSGDAAMFGECITGHHSNGFYYLTRKKDEVALLKDYTSCLLKKASPLMSIYTINEKQEFHTFLLKSNKVRSSYIHLLPSLPIYTIDRELLISVLKRNKLAPSAVKEILEYYTVSKATMMDIMKNCSVTDEITKIEKEDFEVKKPYLLLSETFCTDEIYYTYEEYTEHLRQTREFEQINKNYTLLSVKSHPFKNIQISIAKNKWVLISKISHPNIHFLIQHPTLCNAIENMKIAVKD